MALDMFIDSLRLASRSLPRPKVVSGQGEQVDDYLARSIHHTDLWLSTKSVEGFDAADFKDWPSKNQKELAKEVAAFLEIAEAVPPDKPATKAQSAEARKHLERVIEIVGKHVVSEWIDAQKEMIAEAVAGALEQGWYVKEDEKEMKESLLGSYKAPRLIIKSENNEVVLDPIARFGSGRQGVVDLVVMPAFETAYLIAFREDHWAIVSPRTSRSKPFSQATLVNTISNLDHG